MTLQAGLTLAITFLAPLALIAWLAISRHPSRLDAALLALAGLCVVGFVIVVSPFWSWIGFAWRDALVVLYAVALALAAWRVRRRPNRPRGGLRAWTGAAVKLLLIAVFAVQLGLALAARDRADGALALAFPLRGADFVVMHGGASPLINHHFGQKAQRYALDIIALNGSGRRAAGLMPDDLESYAIYGMDVLAPCAGTVVEAYGEAADTRVGGRDLEAPAGNYVAMTCHDHTVVLAHLAPGSLRVAAGDVLAQGTPVGQVGNSGNSTEPHLHIHAVAGRVRDYDALLATATPTPMTFGGRFLVRNDIVRQADVLDTRVGQAD